MLGTGDNRQKLPGVISSGSGIVPPIIWLSVGNSFLAEGMVIVSTRRLILLETQFLGSCGEWNTPCPPKKIVGGTSYQHQTPSRFRCSFLNKA